MYKGIILLRYIPWWYFTSKRLTKWQEQQVITRGVVLQTFFQYKTMCADGISLTLVYLCVHSGMCLSLSVRWSVQGRVGMRLFECVELHGAPVLNKWPPCLCGFLPGVADAWIMWWRVLGATLAQSSWDHLWMWPRICIEWRNGSPPQHGLWCMGGAGEECARLTPCRQNQVLSVWLGTPPSISPVHFPLPRIKSAEGNTSALTTCRQDKQSSMPKCCQVGLTCERSSDNVFITSGFLLSKKRTDH